jgi:hypothetical protein
LSGVPSWHQTCSDPLQTSNFNLECLTALFQGIIISQQLLVGITILVMLAYQEQLLFLELSYFSYFKSSCVYHINKQNVYIDQREGQKTSKYYYNLSGLENVSRDVLCMFNDVVNSILETILLNSGLINL